MSARALATAQGTTYAAAPRARPKVQFKPQSPAERLALTMLWLMGASCSLVFIEPSPYEIATLLAMATVAMAGLTLRPELLPLIFLLILTNIGYTVSSHLLLNDAKILTWIITSWYLAFTTVFLAAALTTNTEARLDMLMKGIVVAGIITAMAGVIGYFRVIGALDDLLLLYDRARSTFKDPNVFGAFMVLPAVISLQYVLSSRFWPAVRHTALFGLFSAAVLLSFSRAAWGQLAFAAPMVLFLTFVTSSSQQRLRIVLLTIAGIGGVALFLAGLLSLEAVSNLLKERLSFNQSYDVGETGRFGRHILGAVLALDVPLGIGPMQFAKIFPEDPHNSYLNAFMSGGWLAGVCYPVLVLVSLFYGMRAVFTRTPWQRATIVIYTAYFTTMAESAIIDSDHWRHAFLILGILWGLIVASRAYASDGFPNGNAALAHPHPPS
jgi:hypothetical protein